MNINRTITTFRCRDCSFKQKRMVYHQKKSIIGQHHLKLQQWADYAYLRLMVSKNKIMWLDLPFEPSCPNAQHTHLPRQIVERRP